MEKKERRFNIMWKGKNVNFLIPLCLIMLFSMMLAFYAYRKWNDAYLWERVCLFFCIGIFFYIVRPGAAIHKICMNELNKTHKLICVFVVTVTCITACFVMSISDWWSDSGPDYQFQYEAMTEAVLNGHLYLDLEVSPKLMEMENPYDSIRRSEENVPFYWDHAFYQGHYYMYFGVVPVFILFVPLKILGISLYSYQASQIFVMLIILGMHAVFNEVIKYMCPKIPLSAFLSIATSASWVSTWYAVKYPALYCTANTSGVCLAVWGFYFCYRAFVVEVERKKIIIYSGVGALLSALTFGCRPTIGFYCLILIPLMLFYLQKNRKMSEIGKTLVAFCIPFAVVGALLMLYNYMRFDNPFEFGQSYQLTTVDQHTYSANKIKINECLTGLLFHFFGFEAVSDTFPFIHHDGCFILFPILFIGFKGMGLNNAKGHEKVVIKGLAGMILLSVAIISCYHVIWAPIVYRRYSLDFNFLLSFLVMLGTCGLFWQSRNSAKLSFWLTMLGAYTFVICFLLFFVDYDYSIATHQPEILEKTRDLVIFWKKYT